MYVHSLRLRGFFTFRGSAGKGAFNWIRSCVLGFRVPNERPTEDWKGRCLLLLMFSSIFDYVPRYFASCTCTLNVTDLNFQCFSSGPLVPVGIASLHPTLPVSTACPQAGWLFRSLHVRRATENGWGRLVPQRGQIKRTTCRGAAKSARKGSRMLRLAYLLSLYVWYGGNLSSLVKRQSQELGSADKSSIAPYTADGRVVDGSTSATTPTHTEESPARGNDLKRGAIVDKLTALTVVTSIVADLDLFADWYFFNEGLESEPALISSIALAFGVIGTVMYVLLTVEFYLVDEAWALCGGGGKLSPLQHVPLGWQLAASVIAEDLPQLAITCVTTPSSVAGVVNIATAAFAVLAKTAEAFATRRELPIHAQLRMIETNPRVARRLFERRRTAEELANNAARLAVLANELEKLGISGSDPKRQAAIVFEIIQTDNEIMNDELSNLRDQLATTFDLRECGIDGKIEIWFWFSPLFHAACV